LISLSQYNVEYKCFAPSIDVPVKNHKTSEPLNETRNTLVESARIARGEIQDLNELNVNDFDGLVFPGGYGAALNLSDWGKFGAKAQVIPLLEKIVTEFHKQSKPICAICIAPAIVAKTLGDKEVQLTIGDDKSTASEIEKTGAIHVNCSVNDYVSDRENKVITTPAYMYEAKPFEVFQGINKAIKEFVEMA
jgi:enhancing lycopene biosynthesis protein 2